MARTRAMPVECESVEQSRWISTSTGNPRLVTPPCLGWCRYLATEIRTASVVLCLLGAFIVIRAASFHDVDLLLGYNTIEIRWNKALELGIILSVAITGLCDWKDHKNKP
jgi:hypothetical protein